MASDKTRRAEVVATLKSMPMAGLAALRGILQLDIEDRRSDLETQRDNQERDRLQGEIRALRGVLKHVG